MTMLLLVVLAAVSTPQRMDRLKYGDRMYGIHEIPMLGLWHYGDDEPPSGRFKAPQFDSGGSGNWVGYRAKWSIHNSTLYLDKIDARKNGKRIKNEEILVGKKFPLKADWYTGRIHLVVGGTSEEDNLTCESVIVFHIEKGEVVKTTFEPKLSLVFAWNGLPFSHSEVQQ